MSFAGVRSICMSTDEFREQGEISARSFFSLLLFFFSENVRNEQKYASYLTNERINKRHLSYGNSQKRYNLLRRLVQHFCAQFPKENESVRFRTVAYIHHWIHIFRCAHNTLQQTTTQVPVSMPRFDRSNSRKPITPKGDEKDNAIFMMEISAQNSTLPVLFFFAISFFFVAVLIFFMPLNCVSIHNSISRALDRIAYYLWQERGTRRNKIEGKKANESLHLVFI